MEWHLADPLGLAQKLVKASIEILVLDSMLNHVQCCLQVRVHPYYKNLGCTHTLNNRLSDFF